MAKTELLAPAKNIECAIAAINSGADAIYIGANAFGARKNAGNSLKELEEIIKYAHQFWVKVYVTINTILSDEELEEAKKLIHKLHKIKADAIIFQDFGILELARKGEIPNIPLHASTQCNNRTYEKVKFFEKIGVKRVILARELSLAEIKNITKNTDVQIECFIHGALCVSYSGECYLSASCGGRSANRGECAQPCRKKYSVINENGEILAKNKYMLSLKDFNATKKLEDLVRAGVASFKIEGRLKDANYVRNVVLHYRRLLDKISKKSSSGTIIADFEPNPNKSFNRSFTEYFLEGRVDCYNLNSVKSLGEKLGKVTAKGKNYIEINAKINAGDGLCFFENNELAGFLVNKVEGKRIYPNKMPNIKIGDVLYRNQDHEFEKLLKNSKTARKISVDFKFKENTISALDENFNKVEFELEGAEPAKDKEKMKTNFISQMKKTGETIYSAEHISIEDELPFIPISKLNEIRRILLEKLTEKRLENYRMRTQQEIQPAEYFEDEVDYKANIMNSSAKNFYEECLATVIEFAPEHTKKFGKIELMRTKHCIKYALNMCKSKDKLFLLDEEGRKFNLDFDCKNCEMIISRNI
ncbi:U32 family peptidase [bacterium]|nr:U32 family peptidase [bacterium]